jgi:hypothetical protein
LPDGCFIQIFQSYTKIIIRGKGSVKEGKIGRVNRDPLPGEDEPLHAYITGQSPEAVKGAVERVRKYKPDWKENVKMEEEKEKDEISDGILF